MSRNPYCWEKSLRVAALLAAENFFSYGVANLSPKSKISAFVQNMSITLYLRKMEFLSDLLLHSYKISFNFWRKQLTEITSQFVPQQFYFLSVSFRTLVLRTILPIVFEYRRFTSLTSNCFVTYVALRKNTLRLKLVSIASLLDSHQFEAMCRISW